MESHGQAPCRNTEVFTIRDGKIGHVDVYFGADTAESVTREEIRGVIERRAEAIRRKMRSRPPHVCIGLRPVLAGPPLKQENSVLQDFENWFASRSLVPGDARAAKV